MASTTIDGRGTVDSSSGTGLTVSVPATFTDAATFTYLPETNTQTVAASGSITYPGVYTITNVSSAGVFLPNPSTIPGGVVVFRTLGAAGGQRHFLTASVTNLGKFITDGTDAGQGSRVTLSTAVGSSVSLISDGLSFCVIGNSGSLAFAGT